MDAGVQFDFFSLCYLSQQVSLFVSPFCYCDDHAAKASLIKVLPDIDAASPAVRRACQPAGGIEVNKPKCVYMLRDRLLRERRGSGGTDLLRFCEQP